MVTVENEKPSQLSSCTLSSVTLPTCHSFRAMRLVRMAKVRINLIHIAQNGATDPGSCIHPLIISESQPPRYRVIPVTHSEGSRNVWSVTHQLKVHKRGATWDWGGAFSGRKEARASFLLKAEDTEWRERARHNYESNTKYSHPM